jgi:hypothetical protein
MRARQLLLLSSVLTGAFGLIGACGGNRTGGLVLLPLAGAPGSPSGSGAGGTTGEGTGVAGNGPGTAGTTGAAGDGPGTAGTTGAAGNGPGTAGTTGAAGNGPGTTGAAGVTGAGGSGAARLSSGCGKAPAGCYNTASCPTPKLNGSVGSGLVLGSWSDMADQPARAGWPAPISVTGPDGKMYNRGFYVWVPRNYDNTKPTRVIYEGAGCGDSSVGNGGTAAYQYQNVDTNGNGGIQTIQVGIDYDPNRADHCYDDQNPKSNDFAFFPILHKWVEENFCVDMDKQMYSGYSTGSWFGQQLNCAFPDVLRAGTYATGNEPPNQPTCVNHPVAVLYLHDIADPYNSYNGILPACTRMLQQNGCTTTQCVPSSTTTTTAYPKPTLPASAPQNMQCVQFNGCPATAPVVFCTTQGLQGDHRHYIGDDAWVTPLFWDFLSKF